MAFSALPASTDGRDLKLFYHGKFLLQFISFSLSYFPICKYNVHVHDLINCDVSVCKWLCEDTVDRHPELTEMCLRLIILFIEASDSLNNSGKKITLSTCTCII